ncbi:MAG: S-layer homology domain-containing protein [Clostridia bacterium]|nr:S-layer homology domain-containing protein [Clostridia bacterium]
MKKKIFFTICFVFILLIIGQKNCFAKNVSWKNASYYVPDGGEIVYGQDDNNMHSLYYRYYKPDTIEYNDIGVHIYEYPGYIYQKKDVDNRIQDLKSSYNNENCELLKISGDLCEINGVVGYKINCSYRIKDLNYVKNVYLLEMASDNYMFYLSVETSSGCLSKEQAEKIINSIKIKDTVLIAKGIPFTDVSKSSWYFSAVKDMYDNSIISGLNNYTFGPYEKLTRGMIVTILWRMEGSPANDGKSIFTDVNSKSWYAQAIKWAADNKIVSGYTGTTKFGPKDDIKRQDLAGILRNYAKYKGKNINATTDLTKYSDYNQISNYAKASMEWAVSKGVITGNTKTKTLNPKGTATRAEAASMIQKYCNKVGR